MSDIELYYGSKGLEPAERIVLNHLRKYFSDRNIRALIASNVTIMRRQIDLFVATDKFTLQIEVKGYRKKHLIARTNGDWFAYENPEDTPSKYGNGHDQAIKNGRAIKNSTAQWMGQDNRYDFPQGVLVFEPTILPDFNFGDDLLKDPRIIICGLDKLSEILDRKKLRQPWAWHQVEEFVRQHNLTRYFEIDDALENPAYYGTAPDKLVEVRPSADWEFRQARQHPARQYWVSPIPRRPALYRKRDVRAKRRRRAIATMILLCLMGFAAFLWHERDARPPLIDNNHKKAPSPEKKPKAKPVAGPAPRQHGDKRIASPVTPIPNADPSTPAPATVPTNQIVCPADVDRLGCNGRVGVFDMPQCPAGFHADDASCVPD
ncbi:NERD domain-containing protein [Herbaspirillum sp. WKF16]|uniref:nuclease-related domain-containing protein n=1 Tax=Herbaspirillum sp. WKF16 TaxID=3028312 RepID=UPI0023A97B35|nr:NERD domain-containing protein [Herbaspirillum sp. WKF16]WDZ94871.1 NERD domain-containing protein [Herbaspirillum sp. WKF16]